MQEGGKEGRASEIVTAGLDLGAFSCQSPALLSLLTNFPRLPRFAFLIVRMTNVDSDCTPGHGGHGLRGGEQGIGSGSPRMRGEIKSSSSKEVTCWRQPPDLDSLRLI